MATVSLAAPAAAHMTEGQAPEVAAPVGTVRGDDEGGVVSFKGIPYAAAPVGELRWKPPVAASDWSGVRNATAFGPACYQPRARGNANNIYEDDIGEMSEDCLSLNIWAPKNAARAPVFVWIHGGALIAGASKFGIYDGARMAREGVVFVSLNYRLGVLGFLAHPELSAESSDGISGNYGLQDQIEALRWIKRNIAAFGGDPENVTIAGESAGALSVMYLMTSPPAEGLFDKAISQSAYMVSTPALKEAQQGHPTAESLGVWFAEQAGAGGISELRGKSARSLTSTMVTSGYPTWATVDGKIIPRQTVDIFDRGEQAKVPLLVGFNSGEIRSLRRLLPKAPGSASAYEAAIRQSYGPLADRFLALYPSSNVDESMLAATRDALYGWTAERMARGQQAIGQPAYLYLFDHGYPAADKAGLHAFHASEIPFALGTIGKIADNWPKIPDKPEEHALSDAMVGYWSSFARTGQPSAAGAPTWLPYDGQANFMSFEDVPRPGRHLMGDRFGLYEETVCRRRAAGDVQWNWNVGVAAPPMSPQAEQCR